MLSRYRGKTKCHACKGKRLRAETNNIKVAGKTISDLVDLPIIKLMSDASEKIDLKIVLRDENEVLMNQFLTNGAKSIPKLLLLDETFNLINHWGPRPEGAKNLIIEYKANHGIVDEAAKIALQKWYLDDKGISTMKEIVAILQ
jgi:hypothetical protein